MNNLIPHSFSLHPDHQVYFLIFALLMISLSAISTVLRVSFSRAPYSLLVIALWSLLLTFCFVGDYFLLTRRQFGVALLALFAAGIASIFLLDKRKENFISFRHSYSVSNSLSELIRTLFLWVAGLFILLVPLAFGFPENTLVTSHFISNDSVVHSIMGGGIAYMKSRHIDPFYYSAAPRGIHSFTFYFHGLFREIPVSHIILPTAIASYSVTVLSADALLRTLNVSRLIRFLGALLPVCAFLPMSAIYAIFLGQSSATAPTFAALAVTFSGNRFGNLRQSLLLLAMTTVGAVSAYGLFSGSLIGFGILISIVFQFAQNPTKRFVRTQFSELLDILKSPLNLGLGIILLALIYPSIRFALYVLEVQGNGSVASDLASAVGNLPEGYLSPLHLSGLWPPGIGYREQLVRYWSAFGSALLFVILLQSYFVTRVSKQGIGFLLTLGVPCFATTVLINSPYIHFKYYSCFVAGFLVLAAAGFDVVRENLGRALSETKRLRVSLLSVFLLIGFEAACVLYPLPTATIIPSLTDGHFATFEAVWKTVEGKRTMVLTKEDWFQFGAQEDDFVPLIIYIPQVFRSNSLDAIVVDRAWKQDSLDYLKQFPKLHSLVQQQKCMTVIADRFEIYLPNC